MKHLHGIVVVAIVAVGCRSVATPVESSSPGPVADASAVIDVQVEAAPRAPVIHGLFHLDKEPDERNLVIESDGTFFWEIFGCDFSGGGCGVWRNVGTTVVLSPAPPAKSLMWTDTVGVGQVVEIVLTESGGVLEARARAVDGTMTIQKWYPGQVCAHCGGGLGPTGKLAPCHRPLTKRCP